MPSTTGFLPRRLIRSAAGLSLGLGLTAVHASDAPVPRTKEFTIERFQWQAAPELAKAVRRLVVRNDYGDIRARYARDGVVLVTAVMQRLGSSPDIGVNVERHGDALAVTVVAPPGRQAIASERPGKTDVDRADLVVYVPAEASLEATSLRGMVEARRLKGRIDAETLDGEIRAETEGAVRVRTVSGDVTATIGPGAPSVIETASGSVWLSVPEGANPVLQVETSGKVTSAIGLKDEPASAGATTGPRRMAAPGGPGGVAVIVRSESGAVEIVQRRR